jgi:hypothetical protein
MAKARAVKGLKPRATFLSNARAIVRVRVDEMYGFAHAIGDLTQDEDLHNMRIAAKRLRYTLEMFRVCLTDDGHALIDVVKEIQERIGEIHDADVLVEVARLRLAGAAQRRATAFADAASAGDEESRLAAVKAVAGAGDALPGLAGLIARAGACRARCFDALTLWWSENGGAGLRERLVKCCLEPQGSRQ